MQLHENLGAEKQYALWLFMPPYTQVFAITIYLSITYFDIESEIDAAE